MRNVTAVVLFCCTENLIDYSIGTFRKFYPNMKLIIIDNSGTERIEGLSCTKALNKYCETDKNSELFIMSKNLGHGFGMHYGFQQVKTTYAYVFESDVTMREPGLIEAMHKLAKPRMYSVGPTATVTYAKAEISSKNVKYRTMRRLWPYSSLLSIKTYFKYPPWNSDNGTNAAPLKDAMRRIADSGLEKKLMIEFDVDKYVTHLYGGTRGRIGIPVLEDHKKWTSHYSKSS